MMSLNRFGWRALGASLLAALLVNASAFAASWTLDAVADTEIRYGTKEGQNYGALEYIYIRQLNSPVRDFIGYLRFDLDELKELSFVDRPDDIEILEATLTLTKINSEQNATIISSRFALYGLGSNAGNTAQDWDENVLTWNNSGSETDESIYPGPPADGTAPLDPARVTDLDGDVSGVSETITNGNAQGGTVEVASVAGGPVAAFLQDRLESGTHGGLATFILDFPSHGGSSKGYGIGTKDATDAAYHPKLTVTFVPEPSTASLVLLGLSALGLTRRRSRQP